MTSGSVRKGLLVLVLAAASATPQAKDPKAEAFLDAARTGDVAAVKRLLDEGAGVDTKSRYGATALSFAADKGSLELVDLLLARGAQVDVRDTFYGATPLSWAVNRGFPAIALRLVEKGAKEPEQALELAVKQKDEALAKAVLARGPLPAPARAMALGAAREAKADAIVALLEAARPAPEPEVPATGEQLAKLASSYTSADGPLQVDLRDGRLVARQGTGPEWSLVPLGDDRFRAREADDVWLQFGGRAGTIEGVSLQRGSTESYFGRGPALAEAGKAAKPELPSLESPKRTAAAPWPSFRGAHAGGLGDGQGAPTSWEVASGRNLLWKAAIPGLANSSPIVWGDRIYLTTAVSTKPDETFRTGLYGDVDSVSDDGSQSWRLLCLDKKSGKTLWEKVAYEGRPRIKRHLKSTHANPTPATDGRYVVAVFGSEGLFAYDRDGQLVWKKDLGVLDSGWFYDPTYQWGFSSSPVIYGDTVIVQADIQKGSFIAAFDLATGKERWRTAREEIPTWGTPTVVSGPKGDELVTNGTTVRAYDAKTGALLWTIGPSSEVTVATPVAHDGIVYVTAGYPPVRPVYAVRAGSRGKLDLPDGTTSSEAVAWSSKEGTYTPTPVVYRGHLYTLHNNGRLTCYDARTGEVVYRTRVGSGGSFTASPVAADGRLFIATEEGDVFVVRTGPQFEVLATNTMGEAVMATPAISDGVLLVRTVKHLFGLGTGP